MVTRAQLTPPEAGIFPVSGFDSLAFLPICYTISESSVNEEGKILERVVHLMRKIDNLELI
jgi:hypothetical protein